MNNTKSGYDLDWTLLFQAFQGAFEWSLDVAANFARGYPDEVAAVERVRAFMRKQVTGVTAHVRIDDVMFTLGLMVGAIERDLGPTKTMRPHFATFPRRGPHRSDEYGALNAFSKSRARNRRLACYATEAGHMPIRENVAFASSISTSTVRPVSADGGSARAVASSDR